MLPESFLREGLGVWDEVTKDSAAIPVGLWNGTADNSGASLTLQDVVFAVDMPSEINTPTLRRDRERLSC